MDGEATEPRDSTWRTSTRSDAESSTPCWPRCSLLDDGAWLQLRVGTEEFIHPSGKTGFWLDEINSVAGDLADKLAEWICESSFGWGEWRSLPGDWIPPAPRAGRHVVSVHFADDGGLPLWAGGAQAT